MTTGLGPPPRLSVWEEMLLDGDMSSPGLRKFGLSLRKLSSGDHPFWNYCCHGNTLRWHLSTSKYRVLLGGNRSGKTYAASFDLASRLIGINPWHSVPLPSKCLVVVPGLDQVGQVTWPTLQPFLRDYYIEGATSWHDRKRNKPAIIRVKSHRDSRIISELHFMSDDQDTNKFSGPTWDVVYFDEHFSDDVFTEAAIRGTVDRNGIAMISLTPIEPFPWLQAQEERCPEGWDFVHRSTNENRVSQGGFIPDENVDGLWQGFVSAYGADVAKARFEGLWYGLEGMCYPHFSVTYNVCEPFPIPDTTHWHRYIAVDFGWSNPFAALWIVHDFPNGLWYVVDEYCKQGEYYRNHAKELMGSHRPWNPGDCEMIGDHEDAQGMAELSSCLDGLAIRGQNKRRTSVRRGIELVGKLIHLRKLKVFSHCKETIREHMKYRWHPDKDEPLKIDDHTCDALRGCLFTAFNPATFNWGDEYKKFMSEKVGGGEFDPLTAGGKPAKEPHYLNSKPPGMKFVPMDFTGRARLVKDKFWSTWGSGHG